MGDLKLLSEKCFERYKAGQIRRIAILFSVLLSSISIFGQIKYTGFVGKYPVEFVIEDIDSTWLSAKGVYFYAKYYEPIIVRGPIKNNVLYLYEESGHKKSANFIFREYKYGSDSLIGIWRKLNTNDSLKVSLKKEYDFNNKMATKDEWRNTGMLQYASTKQYFFKIIISPHGCENWIYDCVMGIELFNKKNGELFQKIEMQGEYRHGILDVEIGDFNFDGIKDFSIFEHSYAGPNSSSIYYLFDPLSGKFVNSGFEGSSLVFDTKKKRVYDSNQCCGGAMRYTSVYKIVKNKMVRISRKCWCNGEPCPCEKE
jgi:hypothetical protein